MKYYDEIVQGHDTSLDTLKQWVNGMVWSEIHTTEQEPSNVSYMITVNNVDIYYSNITDCYFFAPEDVCELVKLVKELSNHDSYSRVSHHSKYNTLWYTTIVDCKPFVQYVQHDNERETIKYIKTLLGAKTL